jgi:hypothetical protein
MNAINLKTFLSNPKRIGAIVKVIAQLLLKCDIVVEEKICYKYMRSEGKNIQLLG